MISVWRQNSKLLGIIFVTITSVFITSVVGMFFPISIAPLYVLGLTVIIFLSLYFLRTPEYFLYLTLFVIFLPIGLLPNSLHSFLNRSLTIVSLAVWLFSVITRSRKIYISTTTWMMIFFITWGFLSIVWSGTADVAFSTIQIYTLRFLLFILIIPNMIRNRTEFNGLMNTFFALGWVYIFSGLTTVLFRGYEFGSRLRIYEENENAYGIILLICLIGVLMKTFTQNKKWKNINTLLALFYILLALLLIAMSGSRGSALSMMATLITLIIWRETRKWGYLGIGILMCAFLFAPQLFLTTVERFGVLPGDTLLGGRESIWRAALDLIWANPWIGVGIGNAPYVIHQTLIYYQSVFGYLSTSIHNPILTIWAETGLIGLIFYLGVTITAILSFIRAIISNKTAGLNWLNSYFPILISVGIGYAISWVKGGGMESGFSYFLIISFFLIPAGILQTYEYSQEKSRQIDPAMDKLLYSTSSFLEK